MQQELDTLTQMMQTASDLAVRYGFQVLAALIILVAGAALARWVGNLVRKLCESRKLDVTLSRFFGSTVKILVLVFVVIIAMGKFGISIAPFIAAIGAIAFGASLALTGPLSNYGAGLSIILSRPFVVGNTIQVQGVHGLVKEIGLGATELEAEDGEIITIPNKYIVGEILVNSLANRIVEGELRIGYKANSETAINTIKQVIADDETVVNNPQAQVGIGAFGEDALRIHFRYWVPTNAFIATQYRVNERIYNELGNAGITLPTPQISVTERH